MRNYSVLSIALLAVLLFNLQSCASVQSMMQGTPTSTDTLTPVPSNTPSITPSPTIIPSPTVTPDAKATELAERKDLMFKEIQEYYDAGYIDTTDGEYTELANYDQSLAKVANYQWSEFDIRLKNYVLSAHFKWSSAAEHSNLSGCGFSFDNGATVFLDRRNVVLFTHQGYKEARSGGTGIVHFEQSDEADFTLIVNSNLKKVFVFVNDEFNVEYEFPLWDDFYGYIGYAVLSGTNTDYGTRCIITNGRLWKID